MFYSKLTIKIPKRHKLGKQGSLHCSKIRNANIIDDGNDDNDDDDDDDDDEDLFVWNGQRTKSFKSYFQPRPLSEVLTIANLQHAASKI